MEEFAGMGICIELERNTGRPFRGRRTTIRRSWSRFELTPDAA
jgi:hypothetical protein